MEFWLDTADAQEVINGYNLGILTGVTTNPSILSKDPRGLQEILIELLHAQDGCVAVQVLAQDAAGIIQQGRNLADFSDRFIIKIPVTKSGLEAIHTLSDEGVLTMGTVVYTSTQALLAAEAGADYIAPYISHIEKSGEDVWKMLKLMLQINSNYGYSTRVLGASLTSREQILKCAEIGLDAVTLKPPLFNDFVEDHAVTLSKIEEFERDWRSQKQEMRLN